MDCFTMHTIPRSGDNCFPSQATVILQSITRKRKKYQRERESVQLFCVKVSIGFKLKCLPQAHKSFFFVFFWLLFCRVYNKFSIFTFFFFILNVCSLSFLFLLWKKTISHPSLHSLSLSLPFLFLQPCSLDSSLSLSMM